MKKYVFSFVSVMLMASLAQADLMTDARNALDSCDGQFEAVNDQGQVALDVKSNAIQAKADSGCTAAQATTGQAMIDAGQAKMVIGLAFQTSAVGFVELANTAYQNGLLFVLQGKPNNAANQFQACIDAMTQCGVMLGQAYNPYVEAETAFQQALDYFTDLEPEED